MLESGEGPMKTETKVTVNHIIKSSKPSSKEEDFRVMKMIFELNIKIKFKNISNQKIKIRTIYFISLFV